jgi:hypothetical protein
VKKIIIVILLLTACQENRIASQGMEGAWFLEKADCFCFFEPGFNFKDHALTFNSKPEKVNILNTDNTWFITQKGEYDYRISGDELTIDNSIKYKFNFENNRLILTFIDNPKIADDEITLTYRR